jgi:hypothetical protein
LAATTGDEEPDATSSSIVVPHLAATTGDEEPDNSNVSASATAVATTDSNTEKQTGGNRYQYNPYDKQYQYNPYDKQYQYNPYDKQYQYNPYDYYNPYMHMKPYRHMLQPYNRNKQLYSHNDNKSSTTLSYYITVELILYPGKNPNFLDRQNFSCQSSFEKIRKAYSDLFGYAYAPKEIHYSSYNNPTKPKNKNNTAKKVGRKVAKKIGNKIVKTVKNLAKHMLR